MTSFAYTIAIIVTLQLIDDDDVSSIKLTMILILTMFLPENAWS